MRNVFLLVAAFGCVTSFHAFNDEVRAGKLYPSLLAASFAWAALAVIALVCWEDA
jgi:hypothetical protein